MSIHDTELAPPADEEDAKGVIWCEGARPWGFIFLVEGFGIRVLENLRGSAFQSSGFVVWLRLLTSLGF